MTADAPGSETQDVVDLVPFVPRLALTLPDPGTGGVAHRIEGSLVFADLSGFTAMSERLAKRGRVGAEEVTGVVSATFAELLSVAWTAGGGLLKFGGDALLLAFTDDGHARRAAHAAASMRRALRALGVIRTSAGNVRLRISLGLHVGDIPVVFAGESHRDLLVVGEAASAVVGAEHAASAGRIALLPAAADALPPRLVTRDGNGAAFLGRDPGPVAAPAPAVVSPGVDAATRIPVALRRLLEAGGGASEHREAAIAFVRVGGTDDVARRHGDAELAARLDRLVVDAQSAAEEMGVCFLGTDVDVDGVKLILTAGAPTAAGDDEDRLLHATRRVVASSCDLPVQAGVTAGPLFAGVVGPSFRRTYTVMGDVVNTAARLMAHAEVGEVLATPAVLSRCTTRWRTRAVAPFSVKGKAKPLEAVRVHDPIGVVDDAPDAAPLRGRDTEVRAVVGACRDALDGRGFGVAVFAERGAGASRVVRAALGELGADRVIVARASAVDANVPLSFLRQVLRPVLAIGTAATADETLAAAGAIDAELVRWPGVLGALVGVDLAPSASDAALEPAARAVQVRALALAILRAAPAGTVVVLDKVDAADGASVQLVADLAPSLVTAALASIAISTRPVPWSCPVVALGPLATTDVAEIARVAGAGHVPPHDLTRIATRAEGNPLVALRLVEEVLAGGDADALPATLERLAATRIDKLDPRRRDLLRTLSVLGSMVELCDFEAVSGEPASALAGLTDFVVVEPPIVRFVSEVVRRAAYEGLARRRRTELHAAAADALEADPDRAASHAGALSVHNLAAGRADAAWQWSLAAADKLAAIAAWHDVRAALGRALTASRSADVEPLEVGRVWTRIAQAGFAVGDMEGAEAALRRARALTADDPYEFAYASFMGANIASDGRRFRTAARRFAAALRAIGETGSPWLRARALVGAATVMLMRGDARRALAVLEEARAIAEATDDLAALGHADVARSAALHSLGEPGALEAALAGAETFDVVGDLRTRGVAWNRVAIAASAVGDVDTQAAALTSAAALSDRAGASLLSAFVLNNLGEMQYQRGQTAAAVESLTRSYDLILAAKNPAAAIAGANLVLALLGDGRIDEAVRVWETAREVGDDAARVAVGMAGSLLALMLGDVRLAAERLRDLDAIRHRDAADGPELTVRGLVAVCVGDRGGGEDFLREAVAKENTMLAWGALAALGAVTAAELDRVIAERGAVVLPQLPQVFLAPVLIAPQPRTATAPTSPTPGSVKNAC